MRIEKVSQTTPTSAQIVDGYSTSTTDGYSANYVNNYVEGLHTYSATETIVGTYMDKPLYRKTFIIDSGISSGMTIQHSISNFDLLVKVEGSFRRTDGKMNGLLIGTSDNYSVNIYDVTTSQFSLAKGGSITVNYIHVSLYYTKTTD